MNEQQKKLYWKQFDRRRWRFLQWGTQRFRKALLDQIKPVQPELVTDEPILRAFIDVYMLVGGRFAMETHDQLTGKSLKQDESFFMEFIRQWIQVEGAVRIAGITATTRRRMQVILERGIDEGLGIEEISRIMANDQRLVGISRARVIARTEIISASNKGSLQGAQSTNLNLNKEWISSRDGRTRRIPEDKADHYTIDGQLVGLDKPFEVPHIERGVDLLMFPGDPTAPADTVVQCRCTQGYQKK